jgi:phage tail sheath protein FI
MADLGATGTLPLALDAIFDQINAVVCVIRVADSIDENIQLANYIGGVDLSTGALTGIHAFRICESKLGVIPMLLAAPGATHQRPLGLMNLPVDDQGTGYTTATVTFANAGVGAILPVVAPVIEGGKIINIQIVKPGYNITGALTASISGDGTGAALGTPVVDHTTNPVVGEMLAVADGLRAHIIADCPSTTDSAAIAYRNDFGSRRVYGVEPKILGWSESDAQYIAAEGSARVAGHIARVDNEEGWWNSPSNREIYGIGGLARPIDWAFNNPVSRANLLNEQEIATYIHDEGWYLWGDRTFSSDPQFAFFCVSRSTDVIDISIAKAHRWAVDRGITKGYFRDVAGSVSAFFRYLKTLDAVLGGECFVDPAFNPDDQIKQGHATFSYEFTPIYPAERVTFRSSITDRYIRNLFI